MKNTLALFVISIMSVHCGPLVRLDYPVTILNYHAIETEASTEYTRATSDFIHDLDTLQAKYAFMTLNDLNEIVKNNGKVTAPTIILNFDDGLSEHYDIAFKELSKRGIPADFFVPTARVGTSGNITWDQILEMSAAGYSMQSHSYDHIHLADKLDGETQEAYEIRIRFQLQQSLDDFAAHGLITNIIATPFGSQNDTVIQIAYDVGYELVRGTGTANAQTMFMQTDVTNIYYQDVLDVTDINLL